MVLNNFKEKITSKKRKLIILLIVFIIGILVGFYITFEFFQPEIQIQLNQKITNLTEMNQALDNQINLLSDCLNNEGINPNECS